MSSLFLDPKENLVEKRPNGAIVLKPEISRKMMFDDRLEYAKLREETKNERAIITISKK